ncbi:MAG: keratin [Planctomycetes bacterium]|nr:keratin [Planctomycetota bacterium]
MIPALVPLTSTSRPTLVALIVLLIFVAFLIAMGALLVTLVTGARKEGAGGGSGCLLALGFGLLTAFLALLAFSAGVVAIGVAAGPDLIDDLESRFERIDRHVPSAPGSERPRGSEAAKLREELEAAMREAEQAYDEALRGAQDAGREVQQELRAALQEAADALREAREAAREAADELGQELPGGPALPQGPGLVLRFDVHGDPGPGLSELVERVGGQSAELVVHRPPDSDGPARWSFRLPTRSTAEVTALEDALREQLASLELPAGARVEFRDVVLQDGQRHDEH